MIYSQKILIKLTPPWPARATKGPPTNHFLIMVRFFNTDLIVCEFFYKLLFVMVLNASKIG